MKRMVKIFVICLFVGVISGLIADFFLGSKGLKISIIIGVGVSLWLVLLANDWCPGVWFLRWVGILPHKK